VPVLGALGQEAVRIESLRLVPEGRLTVCDPGAQRHVRLLRSPVTVHLVIGEGFTPGGLGRGVQSQRLVDHPARESELREIFGAWQTAA
jgi:hypothetical protein